MPYDAVFDANTVAPKQGGRSHPIGNKFPFTITGTSAEKVKDKNAGLFKVEFTSQHGSITHNYNLWNESDVARRISNEQLAALCHAVGIFNVDFKNDGASLRGGQGLMDVNFQKGQEPSAEKPEGGYVELTKVYDKMGNEPGKNQQQPQSNQQPQGQVQQLQQQQPQSQYPINTGFSSNPNTQQVMQQQPQQQQQQNWANNTQQQQPQSQTQTGGWTQQQMPENAPWKS